MMKQLFSTFSSSQVVCLYHLAYKISVSLVFIRNQSSCLSIFYPTFLSLSLQFFLDSSPDLPLCPASLSCLLNEKSTYLLQIRFLRAFSIYFTLWKDTVLLKSYKIHTGMLKAVTFWP